MTWTQIERWPNKKLIKKDIVPDNVKKKWKLQL